MSQMGHPRHSGHHECPVSPPERTVNDRLLVHALISLASLSIRCARLCPGDPLHYYSNQCSIIPYAKLHREVALSRIVRLIAAIILSAGTLSAPAFAHNGYSFIDAEKSPLNYRASGVAPRLPCEDLMRVSSGQLTIVSAELVVAAGDVPEFCRVIGTIQPEVKFEVVLPTAWNRRLYMRGNGGYAGEPLDQPQR